VDKSQDPNEPPKIQPIMRFARDEQDKIRKRIFLEAKAFIVSINPGVPVDDLSDEIFAESDKRFISWEKKTARGR